MAVSVSTHPYWGGHLWGCFNPHEVIQKWALEADERSDGAASERS